VPVRVEGASSDPFEPAQSDRELPFPITENYTYAEVLIGGNQPTTVIPAYTENYSCGPDEM